MVSCSETDIAYKFSLSDLPKVLKERPLENAWKGSKLQRLEDSTRAMQFRYIQNSDYIGYSFRLAESPIEDTRNVGMRIFDSESFSNDYPNYFLAWKNMTSDTKIYSYSSFDKYSDVSKIVHTVNNGLELKLLSFGLSHKHTYESTFGKTVVNDEKSVFGDLHILLRDSCYRMSYTPNIQKLIQKKYLTQDFLEEIHSIHPYQFFKNYGAFIATDYSTGGRALALYCAQIKNGESKTDIDSKLIREMTASYSWNNSPNSATLKFDGSNSSAVSNMETFSSIKVSVKTLGGFRSNSFSIPQEVNSTSIDLSGWLSSLNNPETHVISDFNQNGLIPITDFILEKNLKEAFNGYINEGKEAETIQSEPAIIIFQVSPTHVGYSVNEAQLRTRNNQYIPLSRVYGAYSYDTPLEDFWNWIDDLSEIFEVEVINGSAMPFRPKMVVANSFRYLCGDYENLIPHKNLYKKLVNKGVLYFIDEVDKVGFSILNNSKVIEEYGLTNFLSTLSPATISYETLIDENYTINAL